MKAHRKQTAYPASVGMESELLPDHLRFYYFAGPKCPRKKTFQITPAMLGFVCQSVWLYLCVQGKRKSNHCSTGFATSETKQFLIGYVYDGETRSCDVSLRKLNCGSLLGTRTWIPGDEYEKKSRCASRDFSEPMASLPSCRGDTSLSEGGVFGRSQAKTALAQAGFQLTRVAAVAFRARSYSSNWIAFFLCG